MTRNVLSRRELLGLALVGAAAAAPVTAQCQRGHKRVHSGKPISDPRAAAPTTLAIHADTIYTIAGPPIRNGVVIVRGGKIAAIGSGVAIPAGAQIIRCAAAMPGVVDPHAYFGCLHDNDESLDAITPDLRMRDAFDPSDPSVSRAARAGVTACCVMPGNGNAIGGIGSVYRIGERCEILRNYTAQKISMSAANSQRNPTSRAGVIALIRAAMNGVTHRQAVSSVTQTDLLAGFPTRLDQRIEALAPILSGARPVFIHAPLADDVENALTLIDAYRLRACLLHSAEAFEVRDEIAKRRLPVILGPLGFDDTDRTLANPGKLTAAGIPVAFCSDAPLADPGALRLSASLAADRSMPADTALRAITRSPAEILGIGRRTGSLQEGMDADIVLLSGDPLALTSRVEAVISGGAVRMRE